MGKIKGWHRPIADFGEETPKNIWHSDITTADGNPKYEIVISSPASFNPGVWTYLLYDVENRKPLDKKTFSSEKEARNYAIQYMRMS
jgi:hypothetical protein